MSKYPEFLFYAGVSIVGSVYRGVLADFSKDGGSEQAAYIQGKAD